MSLEGQPKLPHNSKEAWQALFDQPEFVPEIAQSRVEQISEFIRLTDKTAGYEMTYVMAVKRAAMKRMRSHISS